MRKSRHRKFLINPTKRIKHAYMSSMRNVRRKPYRSVGLLTLGLGVLSGIFALYKFKK